MTILYPSLPTSVSEVAPLVASNGTNQESGGDTIISACGDGSYSFEWSVITPWILMILYGLGTFHVGYKFKQLWSLSPHFDLIKYFVISVLISCFSRTICFAIMGWLQNKSVDPISGTNDDDSGAPAAQLFNSKFVPLLLDVPDFLIIAAYVLLVLVWCEAFVNSRNHYFVEGGRRSFRQTWTRLYIFFFLFLIVVQAGLYLILFAPSDKWPNAQTIATFLIIVIICGFNGAALPLLFITLYIFLNCRLSGFPTRGEITRNNLRRINHVLRWWTGGRITWGIFTLIVIDEKWLCSSSSVTVNTLAVLCLFIFTELVPFSFSLDPNLLAMIADDDKVKTLDNANFWNIFSNNEGVQDEENSFIGNGIRPSSYVMDNERPNGTSTISRGHSIEEPFHTPLNFSRSNVSVSSESLRDDSSFTSE